MSYLYRTVAGNRGLTPPPTKPPRERRTYNGWIAGGLRKFTFIDAAVGLAILILLYLIITVGRSATLSYSPTNVSTIDTSPGRLPYYAARSLLRMFVALGRRTCSRSYTPYIAAKSRRAERIMIPALDILRSVPILGFLSITVSGFIALFPGSYLGLECASIFAIFTSKRGT